MGLKGLITAIRLEAMFQLCLRDSEALCPGIIQSAKADPLHSRVSWLSTHIVDVVGCGHEDCLVEARHMAAMELLLYGGPGPFLIEYVKDRKAGFPIAKALAASDAIARPAEA